MARKPIQNSSENKRIRKSDIYQEFITWFSSPSSLRWQTGIKDQNDFANFYKVSKDTLSLWKKRPDFEPKIQKIRNAWGRERMADIFYAIYKSALKGNAKSQKIWMDNFWIKDKKGNQESIFSEEDLCYCIEILPKELQLKYTRMLDNLKLDVMLAEEDNKQELQKRVDLYLEEEKWLQDKKDSSDPECTGKYL